MAVAGSEDATPEPPFRNVPRRRRSAARPPKEEEEEELRDDAAPGRGAPPAQAPPSRDVEGAAVASAPACDKKRPLSDRGGDETHVRRAEKRHRSLRAEDAKNGGGGALGRQTFSGSGAPPAPSRGTDVAATAVPESASSSRERPADWVEKERIRKEKMPAQPSVVPGRGKLMADAIRSHGYGSKNKPVASSSRERPAGWVEKERIRKGKMPTSSPRMSAYDNASAARQPSGPGGGKLMADAIRSHGARSKNKPPASSSRERPAGWAEKERIRKGKMPASSPRMSDYDDASAARQPSGPGGGKLMADAIRCHEARSKNKPKSKKRKDCGTPFWYGMGRDGQSTSAAGSDVDHSFFKMGTVVSDMLRATLASLGVDDDAAAPERVYGRLLSNCDRNRHQSRLQMSCKSWRADRDEYPLCAFLTEAEKEKANGKGLTVNAYDRRGEKYEMTIRYLGSNKSYRLINKWGHFLEDNGLVVANGGGSKAKHVMLDLWLFRPPGGEVGMVMLHYFKGDAAHADAALEEEEDRRAIRRRGNDDDSTAVVVKEEPASPPEPDGGAGGTGNDAVTEDVAGGASGKVEDDGGGVKSEAASAPSPSEEPDGGAKAAAGEEQAGPLPSPDADGMKMEEEEAGSAPVQTAAQLSPDASGAAKVEAGGAPGEADGTKKADKEASAGTTEAAAGQASSSDAGGAAKKAVVDKEAGAQGGEDAVQAPSPPPPVDGAGGAKKATFMFGLTQCDVSAAYTLLMLSQGHWA